jgi:hypothetical protein
MCDHVCLLIFRTLFHHFFLFTPSLRILSRKIILNLRTLSADKVKQICTAARNGAERSARIGSRHESGLATLYRVTSGHEPRGVGGTSKANKVTLSASPNTFNTFSSINMRLIRKKGCTESLTEAVFPTLISATSGKAFECQSFTKKRRNVS